MRAIRQTKQRKEVAVQGRITINGKVAKASSTVKVGDELAIRFGQKIVTARVEELRENVKKEDALKMFTILKEERLEKVEPEFIDDEE